MSEEFQQLQVSYLESQSLIKANSGMNGIDVFKVGIGKFLSVTRLSGFEILGSKDC